MTEEKQVVKFSVVEADIAKMKAIYMDLKVTGPDDEEGFEAVDSARKVVKKKRVAVDNEEKDLKSEANKWRKKVGSRAKEIRTLIEPIESHLVAQCKIVTDEKARIEAEEDAARQEKIDNRMNLLAGYLRPLPYQDVATMSDEVFETTLAESKANWEHDAELERKEKLAEEERNRLAEEKIAADKKVQDQIAENQAVEAKRLKDAAAKIEADKKALKDEQDRIESAKMLKEAEEKEAARLEQEEIEKENLAKEADERAEALKPEKEKCIDWVELSRDALIPFPELENSVLRILVSKAAGQIENVLTNLHKDIEEL